MGLPFEELLPESEIIAALKAERIKYRNRLFNPIVTIWAFLSQVLDTDKSLHNALSRMIAWLAGAEGCEGDRVGRWVAPSDKKATAFRLMTGTGDRTRASSIRMRCKRLTVASYRAIF